MLSESESTGNLLQAKQARIAPRKICTLYEWLDSKDCHSALTGDTSVTSDQGYPLALSDLANLLKPASLKSSLVDLKKIHANRLTELLKEASHLYYEHTALLPANRLYTEALWVLLLATIEQTIKEAKQEGLSFKATVEKLEDIIRSVEPPSEDKKHFDLLAGFETYSNPHQKSIHALMEDLREKPYETTEDLGKFERLCFEKMQLGRSARLAYRENLDGKILKFKKEMEKENAKPQKNSANIKKIQDKIKLIEYSIANLKLFETPPGKPPALERSFVVFQEVIENGEPSPYVSSKTPRRSLSASTSEKTPKITPENGTTSIIRAIDYNKGRPEHEYLLYDLLIDTANRKCFVIFPGARGDDSQELLVGKGNFGDVAMGMDLFSGTPCAIKTENNRFKCSRKDSQSKPSVKDVFRDPVIRELAENEFSVAKELKMAVLQHFETVSDTRSGPILKKSTNLNYLQVVTVHRLLTGHDLQREIFDLNARFSQDLSPGTVVSQSYTDYQCLPIPTATEEEYLEQKKIYVAISGYNLECTLLDHENKKKTHRFSLKEFKISPLLTQKTKLTKALIAQLSNIIKERIQNPIPSKKTISTISRTTEAPVISYESTFGECLKKVGTADIKSVELLELELARRLEMGVEFLSALDTMHAQDIIHGDIKPKNFQDGKFLDFGTSRKVSHKNRTMDSWVSGTAEFMAPEYTDKSKKRTVKDTVSGKDIVSRPVTIEKTGDVYSAGVSLFGYADYTAYQQVCEERGLRSYWSEHGIKAGRIGLPTQYNIAGKDFTPLYCQGSSARERGQGEGYGFELWDAIQTLAKKDSKFEPIKKAMGKALEGMCHSDPSQRWDAIRSKKALQKIQLDYTALLAEKPGQRSERTTVLDKVAPLLATVTSGSREPLSEEKAKTILLPIGISQTKTLICRMVDALDDSEAETFTTCLQTIQQRQYILDIIAPSERTQDEHTNHPLFRAIAENKTAIFKALFAKIKPEIAQEIIQEGNKHRDLTYFAAQEDNLEALRTILDKLTDKTELKKLILGTPENRSNLIEESSFNLLTWAVYHKDDAMLDYLLGKCPDLSLEDLRPKKTHPTIAESVLHFCAYSHSETQLETICKKFLEEGKTLESILMELSDESWKDAQGLTPFDVLFDNSTALVEKLFEIPKTDLKPLLEKKSDPLGLSPLQIAFLGNNNTIMKTVLQKTDHAIFDLQDAQGKNPLHYLAQSSNFTMIAHLKKILQIETSENKVRRDVFVAAMRQTDIAGLTPLHYLAIKPKHSSQDEDIFQHLLDFVPEEKAEKLLFLKPISPSGKPPTLLPCLYYAAKYGKFCILDSMVFKIKDLNLLLKALSWTDDSRKNILHVLCERESNESTDCISNILKEALEAANIVTDKTALHKKFIELFSALDSVGKTPLMYASEEKRAAIAEHLKDPRFGFQGTEAGRSFLADINEISESPTAAAATRSTTQSNVDILLQDEFPQPRKRSKKEIEKIELNRKIWLNGNRLPDSEQSLKPAPSLMVFNKPDDSDLHDSRRKRPSSVSAVESAPILVDPELSSSIYRPDTIIPPYTVDPSFEHNDPTETEPLNHAEALSVPTPQPVDPTHKRAELQPTQPVPQPISPIIEDFDSIKTENLSEHTLAPAPSLMVFNKPDDSDLHDSRPKRPSSVSAEALSVPTLQPVDATHKRTELKSTQPGLIHLSPTALENGSLTVSTPSGSNENLLKKKPPGVILEEDPPIHFMFDLSKRISKVSK
ncbi:MAG: hypothetical protein KBD23_00725, partial [Gammaproteobacteria bacterium]|nr:hypothetical protein [Gammaproteobacteria bacterium]